MICRSARAQSEKLEIEIFWEVYPSHSQKRLRDLNPFHAKYAIGGSQTENKVYSLFHHNFHFPWLAISTGALHTNTFQGIFYLTT